MFRDSPLLLYLLLTATFERCSLEFEVLFLQRSSVFSFQDMQELAVLGSGQAGAGQSLFP